MTAQQPPKGKVLKLGQLIPGTPVQEVKAERMIFIPENEAIFSANIHFLCGFRERILIVLLM